MTVAVSRDYSLCGWRVRSAIPLPDSLAWEGDAKPVDITIRFASVPDELPDPIHRTPFLQISQSGDCLLKIPAVARYFIGQGSVVNIEADQGVSEPEILLFLTGSALGLLCHQRGLFPLHASCVRMGNGAVAFSGQSGAGKSTLAAAMVRRGYSMLSDDVTVIDTDAADGPLVFPALPRIRLWRDSLEALDIVPDQLMKVRNSLDKFLLPANQIGDFLPQALPLKAIFFLETAHTTTAENSVIQDPAAETIRRLRSEVYRSRQAELLGRTSALFLGAARIVKDVPVTRLVRQADLARLDELVDLIERAVA